MDTSHPRPRGDGNVRGRAIALGWWVDQTATEPAAEPTGTLYLVVDETLPRPVWVAQGNVTSVRVED